MNFLNCFGSNAFSSLSRASGASRVDPTTLQFSKNLFSSAFDDAKSHSNYEVYPCFEYCFSPKTIIGGVYEILIFLILFKTLVVGCLLSVVVKYKLIEQLAQNLTVVVN